jgi:hypothetical protein
MLADSNVVTMGNKKCTFEVPSMIKKMSEMEARCTPPSIAAAPASAYAPEYTKFCDDRCAFTSCPKSRPRAVPTSQHGMKKPTASGAP